MRNLICSAKNYGEMDYLAIQNTMDEDKIYCGQYPFPMMFFIPDDRRRVNCVDPFQASDGVELLLYKDRGYSLAGLEVFGFCE